MKYPARILFAVVSAAALCSCESLPYTDLSDRADYVPARTKAMSNMYFGMHNELGRGDANVEKLNSYYSPNW
jgi:hypothetical protein